MEQIKTEVEIVAHDTIGGQKPQGKLYKVTNYRYMPILVEFSRMLYAGLKSRSANQLAAVVPREVSQFWGSIATIESYWEYARDRNNPVQTPLELETEVHFPTWKQVTRCSNPKMKAWLYEALRSAEVLMSNDSAVADGNIDDDSASSFERQMEDLKVAMELNIGEGGIGVSDNENTGMRIPEYSHVGVIVPDYDNDAAQLKETSPEMPSKGYPDAPDRPYGSK